MVARILNCKATIQVSKLDEAADKQRKYLAQVRAFRHPKSPRKGVVPSLPSLYGSVNGCSAQSLRHEAEDSRAEPVMVQTAEKGRPILTSRLGN